MRGKGRGRVRGRVRVRVRAGHAAHRRALEAGTVRETQARYRRDMGEI